MFDQEIQKWREQIEARRASITQLLGLAQGENRILTSEETDQHDKLVAECEAMDAHIARLEAAAASAVQAAAPVAVRTVAALSAQAQPVAAQAHREISAPRILVRKTDAEDTFQGQSFTRLAIARLVGRLQNRNPAVIAHERWGKSNPSLVAILRAANEVPGLGTGSGDAGAELVTADGRFTGDFIDYLYSKTMFDQLNLRSVPANVTIKGQDGAATGYFVGEGKAIPVSNPDFMNVSLTPLKVAALTAISKELLFQASPSAEQLIRDSLVEASAQTVDSRFFSTTAASSGISPAGIFNGVTPVSTSGTDAANVRYDVQALLQKFITAKNVSGLEFCMSTTLASIISMMRVELSGVAEFPGLTLAGGTFMNLPAHTGDNINSAYLALIKPSDIYKIDDRGISVEMSTDATIEMSSAPTGAGDVPTAQSQAQVSMFQSEMVAVKVVRSINWAKRRSHAAQLVSNAAYAIDVSSG
jgi:HK97 family phage major capsid protein